MDVCFTSHRYAPLVGGYENQLKLLAENLSERFNVKVVTFKFNHAPAFERLNGVEVHRVTPKLVFFRVPLSASYLRIFDKLSFDVLHAHGFVPVVSDLSLAYAKFKKKKTVYTHHFDGTVQDSSGLNLVADFYNKTVARLCMRFADVIAATSCSYAETSPIIRPYLDKVQVIPCLVDCENFKPQSSSKTNALKDKLGLTGKKVALFVGRVVPYKGLEYLVKAFENIRQEMGEEFHLVLVGGGEGKNITDDSGYYQSILRLVNQSAVRDNIHFLGKVSASELPIYYSMADVVVLPSVMRGEAFGSVLLEAMACGTPVVASRISGMEGVLKGDNSVGTYVTPRDYFALSTAIVKMAYQKGDVTERCRGFVVKNYPVEEIVKKYEALYLSLA